MDSDTTQSSQFRGRMLRMFNNRFADFKSIGNSSRGGTGVHLSPTSIVNRSIISTILNSNRSNDEWFINATDDIFNNVQKIMKDQRTESYVSYRGLAQYLVSLLENVETEIVSKKSIKVDFYVFFVVLIIQMGMTNKIRDYVKKNNNIKKTKEDFQEISNYINLGLVDPSIIEFRENTPYLHRHKLMDHYGLGFLHGNADDDDDYKSNSYDSDSYVDSQYTDRYYKYEQSLYHLAAENGNSDVFELLLKLDNDANKYKNDQNKTPMQVAIEKGHWGIVALIVMAKMGSKMKEKAKKEKGQIKSQQGMVHQFLRERKDMTEKTGKGNEKGKQNKKEKEKEKQSTDATEYEDSLMEEMTATLIRLIRSEKSISDDMLVLCWKYESVKCQNIESKHRLWNVIQEKMTQVLDSDIKQTNWQWFDIYLLNSNIWYESDQFIQDNTGGAATTNTNNNNNTNQANDSTPVLYARLVALANKELIKQTKKLKQDIDNVQQSAEAKDWSRMTTFGMNERPLNLRQDNEERLTFPNQLGFDVKMLEKLGLKDFYDSKIYLSNLMVVANMLNSEFHRMMKEDVLKPDKRVIYRAGPVKKIERCQQKAETDYALKPYPPSAQLLDIVRCSLVYQNPSDLMNGINIVMERCKKGDTHLKAVLRKKNMFIENKQEFKDNPLYRYADIKLNCLMEFRGKSMIVEIQYLLQFMVNFKQGCHKLYAITRSEEFINDMTSILSISNKDKQRELMFLIHSEDTSANVKVLAQFLLSYKEDVDLEKIDDNGLNVWHYICQLGHLRMLKFLMSIHSKEECGKYLNSRAKKKSWDGSSWRDRGVCFHVAVENRRVSVVRYFAKLCFDSEWKDYISLYTPIQNDSKTTVLDLACEISNYQIHEAIFDKRNNYGNSINRMIEGCLNSDGDMYDKDDELGCQSFQFFKKLLAMPKIGLFCFVFVVLVFSLGCRVLYWGLTFVCLVCRVNRWIAGNSTMYQIKTFGIFQVYIEKQQKFRKRIHLLEYLAIY